MGKSRIKWNLAGFNELRTMDTTVTLLHDEAEKIAARANTAAKEAGAEYKVSAPRRLRGKAGTRARVSVRTGNIRAKIDNNRNNTLLTALGGGK